MATDPEVMTLVQLLSRYLRDNPHACDTVEGIARWWLGPDAVLDTATLEAALRWLETYRLIEPLRAADGRVRYRRTDTGAAADTKLDLLAQTGSAALGGGSRRLH